VTAESIVSTETDRTDPAQPADPAVPGTVVRPAAGGAPVRTVRRAKVAVTRVDPWSIMKLSFALWVALAIVLVVAVAILWWVLDSSGVFDSLSQSILKVTGTDSSGSGNLTTSTFQLTQFISFGRVMGVTTILAVINTILLTALSTLAAFLFNLSAGLVGGVDITLTETD
jgi:hypothetical protein